MKAILRTKAGKHFSTMKVETIKASVIKPNEVRVKMKTSRINPVDMDLMKGFPSLKYKIKQIGGIDGAGKITALGSNVNNFSIGDEVFFYRLFSDIGTWAEEITIPVKYISKIPKSISLKESGAVALPILTAFESILALNSKKGDTILIHGAGGGVGFIAVQIAIIMGLKVIANASNKDFEDLKKIGVNTLIDYKTHDFYDQLKLNPPDYVFDVIGKKTLMKSITLKPKKVVSIAFPDPAQMHKSGVNLPWLLKKILILMNKKFTKAAKKFNVELIGQVTGANGKLLNDAARLFDTHNLYIKSFKTKTLNEIETNGLNKLDLGKIILFN